MKKYNIEEILNGKYKLKNSDSYTNFSIPDLSILQKELGKKSFLTVAETGIWLGKSLATVYRDIKKGMIVTNTYTRCGNYRIDVSRTQLQLFGNEDMYNLKGASND